MFHFFYMGKIFLAFGGMEIQQVEKRFIIKESFECWNLKKMGFLEFVNELKSEIPPINGNIKDKNYLRGVIGKADMPKIYDRCSWGLLLPHLEDRDWTDDSQILFILNLYSPEFLFPLFKADDMGLDDLTRDLSKYYIEPNHTQNQSDIFKSSAFPEFYKKLLPQCALFSHHTDKTGKWTNEQMLIGMACFLFNDLRKYSSGKNPYTYHREYLDLCVILEMLLMKEDENWKKKRIANRSYILINNKSSNVRSILTDVYHERSEFVHGKTFKAIKRYSMEKVYSDATIKYNKRHFDLTKKATNCVRHLLTAYIYLHRKKRLKNSLVPSRTNMLLIEDAAGSMFLPKKVKSRTKGNSALKKRLLTMTNEILSLMP